jgi:hypothetical protein
MRVDHIENFNRACASIAGLAAEALAEHNRQIAELRGIARQANALAEKDAAATQPTTVAATPDTAASAAKPRGSSKKGSVRTGFFARGGRYPFATHRDAEPEAGVDDNLRIAMRRAEDNPLLPALETDETPGNGSAEPVAADSNTSTGNADAAPVKKPVTSLSDIAFRLATSL